METIQITNDQFQQALAWINGQASTLGEKEVLQMLRTMTDAFRANCRRLREGPVPRFRGITTSPLSLSAILAEAGIETPPAPAEIAPVPQVAEQPAALTPEAEVMQEVQACSKLDSVLLLNAIAYVGAIAGYPVTQSRAQIILYCFYGSRLGAGKERLGIEHPQMWKYGPVFPRAFKRSSIDDRGLCEESYNALMEKDTALMASLSAKTQAMMATPMSDLNAVHRGAGSPYAHVLSQFPDKWGTQIPDEEIAAFFRSKQ